MKKYVLSFVFFVALVSTQARAQETTLQRLTHELCNTSAFFEQIGNGTGVEQYVSASGAVLTVGDTLVLNVPGGSRALTDTDTYTARTNVETQFSTIVMGKPAGFGNILNAMNEVPSNYAPGKMQGQMVVIAQMSVRHDGGRKKPLKLVVLLGEPNGRAFGINKYMSTSDYEASVIAGEIKPLHAPVTRQEAIAKLKEAKDLLDLGLLNEEEYNKIKNELSTIILESR